MCAIIGQIGGRIDQDKFINARDLMKNRGPDDEGFNFIELKKELAGYNFATKTDTEVLLASYIKWGPECLNKLNGQFAFAIYDNHKSELFCARDHLGIKPFYYHLENDKF